MLHAQRLLRGLRAALTISAAAFVVMLCAASAVYAQTSPAGGGSDAPPTQAKASAPSPDTGKRLEPQLFGFIFVGGGIIAAIAVVVTDRTTRASRSAYASTAARTR